MAASQRISPIRLLWSLAAIVLSSTIVVAYHPPSFLAKATHATTYHKFSNTAMNADNVRTPSLARRRTGLYYAEPAPSALSEESSLLQSRDHLRSILANLRISRILRGFIVIFPLWVRFVFQPILMMFYWPLFILRYRMQLNGR